MPEPDDHDHDADDAEGCLCDIKIAAGELTGDADLPPASGGIARLAAAGNEEHVDGCDVDFTKDATPDAQLPASIGGVG